MFVLQHKTAQIYALGRLIFQKCIGKNRGSRTNTYKYKHIAKLLFIYARGSLSSARLSTIKRIPATIVATKITFSKPRRV